MIGCSEVCLQNNNTSPGMSESESTVSACVVPKKRATYNNNIIIIMIIISKWFGYKKIGHPKKTKESSTCLLVKSARKWFQCMRSKHTFQYNLLLTLVLHMMGRATSGWKLLGYMEIKEDLKQVV